MSWHSFATSAAATCLLAVLLSPGSLALPEPELTAAGFPDPRTQPKECGDFEKHEGNIHLFETILCDPDESLARSLRPDQVKFAIAAMKAFERDFGTRYHGHFGARAGIALMTRTLQPIQHFARDLAVAWNLTNETGVLIALRTGDRPAVAFAGGLLEGEALEAAPDDWMAETIRVTTNSLRVGLPGKAIDTVLSGIADAIGGGLGRGMSSLGGQLTGVKQERVQFWKTQFQEAELWKSACAEERCLEFFLDDVRQYSDRFEKYYHETMSYPALNILAASGTPKNVLMLGGGDGGVASRVLEFEGIEHMTLLDIDEQVSTIAKEYFPEVSQALGDPRLKLLHTDAIAWIKKNSEPGGERFDLVIVDFTDEPLSSGWSADFFNGVKMQLKPNGLLVQNLGTIHAARELKTLSKLHSQVFEDSYLLITAIPDYHVDYILGISGVSKFDPWHVDWASWNKQGIRTDYYGPDLHHSIFALPRNVIDFLKLPVELAPTGPVSLKQVDFSKVVIDGRFKQERDDEELDKVGDRRHSSMMVIATQNGYCDPIAKECRQLRWNSRPILSMKTQYLDEAMTLAPMNILGPRGRRVLVLGGGTGYAASLLIQYPNVERIVVVDSSKGIREFVERWFPSLDRALRDRRVQEVREDAYAWLHDEGNLEEFDLIICSLRQSTWWPSATTTRVPGTSKFVARLRRFLAPNGLVVQEAGSVQTPRHAARVMALHRAVFGTGSVWPMQHGLETEMYDGQALDGKFVRPPAFSVVSSPTQFNPNEVDWSFWQQANVDVHHYTPNVHLGYFVMPMETQRLLQVSPPLVPSGLYRCSVSGDEDTCTSPTGVLPPEHASAAFMTIVLSAYQCSETSLRSAEGAKTLLHELAKLSGFEQTEKEASLELSDEGISVALLGPDFHLSLRTWPPRGFATIDIGSSKALGQHSIEGLRAASRSSLACTGGVSMERIFRGHIGGEYSGRGQSGAFEAPEAAAAA